MAVGRPFGVRPYRLVCGVDHRRQPSGPCRTLQNLKVRFSPKSGCSEQCRRAGSGRFAVARAGQRQALPVKTIRQARRPRTAPPVRGYVPNSAPKPVRFSTRRSRNAIPRPWSRCLPHSPGDPAIPIRVRLPLSTGRDPAAVSRFGPRRPVTRRHDRNDTARA